jgi:membrane protein YdbS with pleckstrin-like domain
MRFCGRCGTPLDESTRVSTERDEATRVANDFGLNRPAHDEEATRVASRSPFDELRSAPARVERLPRPDDPPAAPRHSEPHALQQSQPAPPVAREPQSPARARPAEADDAERVVFSIRPTMLYVGLGYVLAALAAVGLTILLATFNLLPALYSVLVSLPLLLIPAYHHLRRNTVKYTLTDSKIEIDQGIVSRRTRNIPLRNIQDVTVSATITQRLLGYGDLIIDNASELGGSTVLRHIPAPRRHADLLLRELRRWN